MWEAVEASTREVGMGEARGRRSKGGGREKERRKEEEEETKERKDSRSEKSNRGIENMEGRGRSSKVRSGSKEVGAREVPRVDKGVWKEAVRENAHEKIVGSCDRCEGGVYAKERESVPFIERRERGSERVYKGTAEKGLHSAIEVTINGAGVLCWKKEWEEEDGTRLPVP